MIALAIIGGIILLLASLLLLPVTASVKVSDRVYITVRLAGFSVYRYDAGDAVAEKEAESTADKTAKDSESWFKKLQKREGGTVEAVKSIAALSRKLLSRLGRLLKHISVRKLVLRLTVADDDAAKTALEYGIICGIVYPVISLLDSLTDLKTREITVDATYDSTVPEFCFSAVFRLRIIFLAMTAFSVLLLLRKFNKGEIGEAK